MITFIHLSDSHLGFTDNDLLDDEGQNIREQDVYDAFRQSVDIILREDPDFVLHTGDIFHRSSPSNRALIFAASQLLRITNAGIPFYMIAGNHDFPRTFQTAPIHELFSMNTGAVIACSEQLQVIEKPEYILHLFPHCNSDSSFEQELEKIAVTDNTKPNILAMHLSFGTYLMDEFGERVFPESKAGLLKQFSYVAMGHWHKFQKMEKYGHVWYAGSTERTSVSQAGYDMGVVKVTIDSDVKTELLPVKLREFAKIIVKNCSTKTEDEIKDELNKQVKIFHPEGSIFHFLLEDVNLSQQSQFTTAILSEFIPGALWFTVSKTSAATGEIITAESGSEALKDGLARHLRQQLDEVDFIKADTIISKLWQEVEEEEAAIAS